MEDALTGPESGGLDERDLGVEDYSCSGIRESLQRRGRISLTCCLTRVFPVRRSSCECAEVEELGMKMKRGPAKKCVSDIWRHPQCPSMHAVPRLLPACPGG
jgi:hypothetical protein